ARKRPEQRRQQRHQQRDTGGDPEALVGRRAPEDRKRHPEREQARVERRQVVVLEQRSADPRPYDVVQDERGHEEDAREMSLPNAARDRDEDRREAAPPQQRVTAAPDT